MTHKQYDYLLLVDGHWTGLPREPWMEDALCAETDPESFFPEKGGSPAAAKKICAGCEVRERCLEFALESDQRFGIWGGTSEKQRRKLRKARATR